MARSLAYANSFGARRVSEGWLWPSLTRRAPKELAPHERIGPPLMADRGHRSMARVDDGIGWQRIKLAPDAIEEQFAVAAGEIVSANALTKQHIASKDDDGLTPVK